MSIEDFKKFGAKCAEDEKVRAKVKKIGLDNIDGWMEYAKSDLGLNFNKKDIEALAKETGSSEELSEDDLERVAGGFVSTTGALVASAVIGAVAGGAAAGTAVTDNVRRGW